MNLKDELNAEPGSFLLDLRTELKWNHTAFVNLFSEIQRVCSKTQDDSMLEREIASGIWFLSHFIEDWIGHENFPKIHSEEYYTKSLELINDLAYQYFMGESVYETSDGIEKKINEIKTLANKVYKQ